MVFLSNKIRICFISPPTHQSNTHEMRLARLVLSQWGEVGTTARYFASDNKALVYYIKTKTAYINNG